MLKKELSERILERFPWTLRYNNSTGKHQTPTYHIEDGWFKLVWTMLEEIEQVFEQGTAEIDVEFDEVIEKYGGLRVYITSSFPEVILSILDKYEDCSYKVCCKCGNKGLLHIRREV